MSLLKVEDSEEKQSHQYCIYLIESTTAHSLSCDISDIKPKLQMDIFLAPNFKSKDKYQNLMQSINVKQRKYCMNLLFWMKTKTEPV